MRSNMEKLIVQMFETKRRIIEQVKQQTDLYDQHLASKCLLEGVAPPEWLWSPYFPSQTSDLSKEEIISGLLFPHSRPSIVCPGSRRTSYQQPVVLGDNFKSLEVPSGGNQPLDKQLLGHEWQYLSRNNLEVGCALNSAHDQDPYFASPRNFQEDSVLETAATSFGQNASSPFPEHSQDERVKESAAAASCAEDLDFTSPGYSQGEGVPNNVLITSCVLEPRITSPVFCQEQIAPESCPDPSPSLARIQRSKSRQRALELRSSVKALKSHSNSKRDLQDPSNENVGSEIPSLRSGVNQTKLFGHDENDEERCGVEDINNSNSQGIEKCQDIESSTISKSRSLCLKVRSTRKSLEVDRYSYIAPVFGCSNSRAENILMNEIALLQPSDTAGEGFAKEGEEKANDLLSKRCNEIVNLDEVTRSKSLTPEFNSKCEYSNFSNSFSVGHLPRISNASPKSSHEVELTHPISKDSESSMVKEARMSNTQSQNFCSGRITRSRISAQECRSKSDHLGNLDSSLVKLQIGHSIALKQSDDEKELLKPITVNAEGLSIEEKNSCDKHCRENCESVDTSRLLLSSRSLSQAGIFGDEPVVWGEPVLHENCGVHGDLVEHSSSSLCNEVETSPCHGRITRSRSSSMQQELAKECKAPCVGSEINLAPPLIEVRAQGSLSSPLHELSSHGNKEIYCTLEENVGSKKEWVSVEGLPLVHAGLKARESEPPEANTGLPVKDTSVFPQDALASGLTKRDSLFVPNALSDVSAKLQAPGELSLFDSLKEPLVSSLSDKSVDKESKVFFKEDSSLLDVLKHAKSASTKSLQDNIRADDIDIPIVEWTQSSDSYLCSIEAAIEESSTAFFNRLSDVTLRQKTVFTQHQVEISSGKSCSSNSILACPESGDLNVPERSIQAFCSASLVIEGSQQQNKRRRTVDQLMHTSASPGGDVLDSKSVEKKLGAVERRNECQNSIHYDVELQKMIGSGSSTRLQLEEGYLFKEPEVRSPANVIFRGDFSREKSQFTLHHGVGSGNTDFMPCDVEMPHLLASGCVPVSVGSPHVQPLCLTGSDDESLPVLEGFVIQTDNEKQNGSGGQTRLDSLKLAETTMEHPSVLEQICRSTSNTPLLHIPATLNFAERTNMNQSVPNRLLEGMFLSNSLSTKADERKKPEGRSFACVGIKHAVHGRSRSDCLPFSGTGSSVDANNPCGSPIGKLLYRTMQKSASSKKRGNSSPDLPCIGEENEDMDEEAKKLLYSDTPGSASSEKSVSSSSQDLPCINEENENIGEAAGDIFEENHFEMNNASDERNPLAVVNENMEYPASTSEATMPVDRQSLESVNTGFSFTATTCNSVRSKLGKQNGGKRRCTGKGKENQGVSQGINGARKNTDLLKNRFSKPKLSENSCLTTQGPRLSEKQPRHNNVVSNITSFIPLVQPKPAAAVVTGKRDVKVKALEAAEAAKRLAEKKENERKIKKEALKLERARQEQENLRKQELEKKKKEEERKKKDAEMAERKRQREEEEKKLKEAKRKRVAEAHRQQREPEVKRQAEKGEKESNTQAMDVRTNAQKELKDEPGDAKKTMQERAHYRMADAGSKTSDSSKSSADDPKVGKVSEEAIFPTETIEESYDISPYKCSDDEDEDEDEDVPNTKFVPAWASKKCVLLTISSQQNVDPEKIFPPKSFCSIGEVLMPRNLRSR